MAKNTGKNKANKDLEKELFENKKEEVKMEEIKNETPVENTEAAETTVGESMEMEMELDGAEVNSEMEEIIAEKLKEEEKKNKEDKHKRGPKEKTEEEKAAKKEEKKEEKKEKALNLKDQNIIQREIKKGRISAPQGRIEKLPDGNYVMKLADGVIFPQDAKGNFKEVDNIARMEFGKWTLTDHAAKALNTDKFKAKHENGEEVEHEYVRVELHKPGRDKDVVELYTVTAARDFLRRKGALDKKKEEDALKKAEKAKEKAEKEVKEEKKEEVKSEQPTA